MSVWCVVLLVASTAHARSITNADEDKVCPFNSQGVFPDCSCESGSQFNPIHNVCPPKSLESFAGSCPDNSTGWLLTNKQTNKHVASILDLNSDCIIYAIKMRVYCLKKNRALMISS